MSVAKGTAFSKTRYLLSEALMRLLEGSSFRRISVGDICREAMVSRSGFYGHFADKYELLEYSISEMLDRQMSYVREQTIDRKLMLLLTGVQKHSRMLHNVFMADLDPEIIGIFERMFRSIVKKWLEEMGYADDTAKQPAQLTAAFYAGGLANVVICWIREGFATPKEELALCQSRLLMRLLGEDGAMETI